VQAILRLRAIAEHGATTDFSSPLTAARTNIAPAWLAWLIFPHQVNYHIEHHLYASVPHYNLPRLHRELRAAASSKARKRSRSASRSARSSPGAEALEAPRRPGAGLLGIPLRGLAQANAHVSTTDPLVYALTKGKVVNAGRVTLELPKIADTGYSVPMTVRVESPMTPASYVRAFI
jgi:hypothetical protein